MTRLKEGIWIDGAGYLVTENQCTIPSDYAIDECGDIWVLSSDLDEVFKYKYPHRYEVDEKGNVWSIGDKNTNPYAGVSFHIGLQTVLPRGIAIDKLNRFHIGCDSTCNIYIFDESGVYTGMNYSVASQVTSPGKIYTTQSGQMVIECTVTGEFYLYNQDGLYTSRHWSREYFEKNKDITLEIY